MIGREKLTGSTEYVFLSWTSPLSQYVNVERPNSVVSYTAMDTERLNVNSDNHHFCTKAHFLSPMQKHVFELFLTCED